MRFRNMKEILRNVGFRVSTQPTALKMTFLIIAICFLSLVVYRYDTSYPPGFCRKQQRYISDNELINVSITLIEAFKNQERKKWATNMELYEQYIKADRHFEQSRKQPGFVHVVRIDASSIAGTLKWMLSPQENLVILNANSGDGWIRFFYDACGELKDSDIGLPASKINTITIKTLGVKS